MARFRCRFVLLCMLCAIVSGLAQGQAHAQSKGAVYSPAGQLKFPADYREWVFLSSGVNMSYSPDAATTEPDKPVFDNVFVDPESYRAFISSGKWPDGTVLVLEIRGGSNKDSINQRGHFQDADIRDIEVHVKDSGRFQGTWSFFGFDRDGGEGKQFPQSASCYSCHQDHGAVDTTFVQFYPTLMKLAKAKGTLSRAYVSESASH